MPTFFLTYSCWTYIPTAGKINREFVDYQDKQFVYSVMDLRKESCIKLIKENQRNLVGRERICDSMVSSFFDIKNVETSLNKNKDSRKAKLFVKIYYDINTNENPTKLPEGEDTFELFARLMPLATIGILPGWTKVDDNFRVQIIESDQIIIEYTEIGSAYQLVSIFLFPFFFFNSLESAVTKKIHYSVNHHYSVYLSNKSK